MDDDNFNELEEDEEEIKMGTSGAKGEFVV